MKKIFFASFLAFLLLACSATKDMSETQKKELLAYTQKFEDENFLIVATYLNPIYPQNDDETDDFILSVYPPNSEIFTQTLKVNDNDENISAFILNDDEPILNKLAFRTHWAKHYKISSQSSPERSLKLEFQAKDENSRLHQVSLKFQKISKSLYWNPR